ncbi:hypothetical protein ACQKDS_14190 [Serratia sp. NPDC078593]|uniref:hypothetical protein n=1 Tax=unclassified Serratia (in: enterobacteria) TaxID=2647522 RepID=UPI0037D987F3
MTDALITLGLCLLLLPLLLWLIAKALSSAKPKPDENRKAKPKTGMPNGEDE